MKHIGIVGAGIMGRLLAWQCAKQGCDVSLFDQDSIHKHASDADGEAAAYTAAGMLTPYSEAESAEPLIVELGERSLQLWPTIVKRLPKDVDFNQGGSLIVAHAQDRADLQHFLTLTKHVKFLCNKHDIYNHLSHDALKTIEPELAPAFQNALHIKNEAWLQPTLVLNALAEDLLKMNAFFYENTTITEINNEGIHSDKKTWRFDHIIDCRGLGAKKDWKNLRAVRGEMLCLYAPDVHLHHLIRLIHPRYRLYIAPRKDHRYVIGATQIESDHRGALTVRSALELLSAAFSIHSGFAEAEIVYSRVNCRPALADNLPRIVNSPGLTRINGLFRHGFLLAPALAEQVLIYLKLLSSPHTTQKFDKVFAPCTSH